MSKLAGMAEDEVARLKRKLQEAGEELEAALRKHAAEQQRVQVSMMATQCVITQGQHRLPSAEPCLELQGMQ